MSDFHVIHVAVAKHESFDDKRKAVEHYLPRNYTVDRSSHGYPEVVVVTGTDQAGWTAKDYVVPRLASGMHFAEIIR